MSIDHESPAVPDFVVEDSSNSRYPSFTDPVEFFKDSSDEDPNSSDETPQIDSADALESEIPSDPVPIMSQNQVSINDIPLFNIESGAAGLSLLDQLNEWHIRNQPQTLNSYTRLLKILRKFHPELPATAATALQSLKKCTYSKLANFDGTPGLYVYLGLVVRIAYIYDHNSSFREFIERHKTLNIILSTDGVALFSCSATRKSIWPISLKIVSDSYNVPPITFACFEGSSKPIQDFLIDLSNELASICKGHVEIGKHTIQIKIVGFTCDSPARCFCKCIYGSNARQGCERCNCQAKKFKYVMCFESHANCQLRCDAEFRSLKYGGHQKGVPILMKVECFDFVLDFFLDVLHLCDEGATKRFCSKVFGKSKRSSVIQISAAQLSQMEAQMLLLKASTSKEFQRPLVPVKFFSQWKACTFRDFALYFGPLLLKPLLPDRVYTFFMKYCFALRILRTRGLVKNFAMIELAQKLLNEFVANYDSIVGYKDTVYCVHSLVHLPSDVKRTQLPLDELSTYPFESSYKYLRDRVQSSSTPIAQIEKRLFECDRYFTIFKTYYDVPLVEKGKDGLPKSLRYLYFKIDLSKNDCFCCLDNGTIMKTIGIFESKNNDCYIISGEVFQVLKPFTNSPVDSSIFGIYVVKPTLKQISVTHKRLKNKMYIFPYKNDYVAFPAVHSL